MGEVRLSLATGPTRPDARFGSIADLAAELRRRAERPAHLWARRALLAAPDRPAEVLAVRDGAAEEPPIAYVCGLGHDQGALEAAIADAEAAEARS